MPPFEGNTPTGDYGHVLLPGELLKAKGTPFSVVDLRRHLISFRFNITGINLLENRGQSRLFLGPHLGSFAGFQVVVSHQVQHAVDQE